MPFPPVQQLQARHPRENKIYQVNLYQPHVLVAAINERHPEAATRFAVNVGVGDGKSFSDPVYPLYQAGYGGLAIDGAEHPGLYVNLPDPAVIKLPNTILTPLNVAGIFKEGGCPTRLDYLKIDIDGYDGPLLRAILEAGFRPKVVTLEINPDFPPPVAFYVHYSERYRCQDSFGRFGGFFGVSFSGVMRLVEGFGYRPAYFDTVTDSTHDLTLVHEDYLDTAADVFGPEIRTRSERDWYLSMPPTVSHFAAYGIDTLPWRARTDFHQLLNDMWEACMRANLIKHGHLGVPFHLTI